MKCQNADDFNIIKVVCKLVTAAVTNDNDMVFQQAICKHSFI